VPTLKELGVNFEIGGWAGIAAPARTPDSIVEILDKTIEKAAKSQEFMDFIKTSGFWYDYKGAKEFAKFLEQEHERMGKILKAGGFVK
jgi:tripartite-type tricarboxylate transporter receptor subunit TctC